MFSIVRSKSSHAKLLTKVIVVEKQFSIDEFFITIDKQISIIKEVGEHAEFTIYWQQILFSRKNGKIL